MQNFALEPWSPSVFRTGFPPSAPPVAFWASCLFVRQIENLRIVGSVYYVNILVIISSRGCADRGVGLRDACGSRRSRQAEARAGVSTLVSGIGKRQKRARAQEVCSSLFAFRAAHVMSTPPTCKFPLYSCILWCSIAAVLCSCSNAQEGA
jgi:hypothetical protein